LKAKNNSLYKTNCFFLYTTSLLTDAFSFRYEIRRKKSECAMPIRYRRRRVLIISVVTVFVIIYLINNRSKNLIDDRNDLSNQVIEKSSTTKKASQSLREEFIEIGGKQLRKIDWHDYEAINRENARTGKFDYSFIDILFIYFSFRNR
jgi:hypothetical protein